MASLPFELVAISDEEREKRKNLFPGPTSAMVDMVVSKPGDVYLPQVYTKMAHAIKNLKLRPNDVIINTYPKAGTTWTQEMVWQIVNGFDTIKGKENLLLRAPFLEISCLMIPEKEGAAPFKAQMEKSDQGMEAMTKDSVGYVDQLESPRVIKTHLALEFLPENVFEMCKVVWVARNVKDSAVSFYHHEKLLPNHQFEGTFDEYAHLFMEGKVCYGSYWHHLKQGWSGRNHPNVKFIWYEDMKKELKKVIRELCVFLDKELSDEKVDLLADHLSFDNFKKNPAVNMEAPGGTDGSKGKFIRKGQVGDWKNYFSGDKLAEWDKWIEENNDVGIPLQFNL